MNIFHEVWTLENWYFNPEDSMCWNMEVPLRSYSRPTSTRPVLPHHLPTVRPPQKNRGENGEGDTYIF